MSVFYLRAFAVFACLRVLSLALHFFGENPYGEAVVLNPWRFFPNAALLELGLILAWSMGLATLEPLLRLRPVTARGLCLAGLALYLGFGQLDNEVVRWLGEHINMSFLSTYFGFRDAFLWGRIVNSDRFHFALAGIQVLALWPATWWLWRRRDQGGRLAMAWSPVSLAMASVLFTFPFWWNWSDKRWRRIRPAAVGIVSDTWKRVSQGEVPRRERRAYADLVSLVRTGRPADTMPHSDRHYPPVPAFPLYDSLNLGGLDSAAFRALPPGDRPNIVFLIVETLRGWKTGFVPDNAMPTRTPQLDSVLLSEGLCFPWAHSNGFPSVEGGISIHLGLWPHFRRAFISDYLHIRTRSIPEGLRMLGYHSEILFGYDPSFDNFTPWLRKWYDRYEYDDTRQHDGLLVDRLIAMLDTLSAERPFLTTLWTTTMHPPFDIPASENVPVAADPDQRYDQAIRYTEKHLLRLFRYLRARPDWNRTLVVLVGDHSDYDAYQLRNPDVVGALNPGHTWTNLALWGGWPGLREKGRRNRTVSQIDIAPTLFRLLDARFPNHFIGRDLLDTAARDVLCMRYGQVALIAEERRVVFDMESDSLLYFELDKSRKLDYALLEGHTAPTLKACPPSMHMDLDRYRDLLRAYGQVLDRDALLPKP